MELLILIKTILNEYKIQILLQMIYLRNKENIFEIKN
jgi:hypothetical protein